MFGLVNQSGLFYKQRNILNQLYYYLFICEFLLGMYKQTQKQTERFLKFLRT